MCRVSTISDDWIVKGFHLHMEGVELVMRPDHLGTIVFKKVFRSTPNKDAEAAISRAQELLEDVEWRARFHREALRAREFLRARGLLAELARGRAAEMTFLAAALHRMGIKR